MTEQVRDEARLRDGVRRRLEGTAYVVEETGTGFDVHVDVEDSRWWGPEPERTSRTVVHHVAVDATSGTLRVTDDLREVVWSAGAHPRPHLGVSVERTTGRVERRSVRWTLGDGEKSATRDFSFDAAEGRRAVRQVAREQGWAEEAGAAQRVGVAVAVAAVVLVLVVAVVLVVVLVL